MSLPGDAHKSLRINKAHWPVTVLGFGRRIGLWVQGCSIRCKGCVSMDTWDAAGGTQMRVADVLRWCQKQAPQGCDGITISGGEPFDQSAALLALLQGIRLWRNSARLPLDVLCYSGYPLKTLQEKHARILGLLDVLISEPYVQALPAALPWRGSSNQRVVPLSPLGRERYAQTAEATTSHKSMQVSVENGHVWMIGIPARGDMEKLQQLCAARGLGLDDVSWRR